MRAEYNGLRVDPCVSTAWDGFSVMRRFRGQVYRITAHNPQHVSKRVSRMVVDGNEIEGNLIPPGLTGLEHTVEVWLGK